MQGVTVAKAEQLRAGHSAKRQARMHQISFRAATIADTSLETGVCAHRSETRAAHKLSAKLNRDIVIGGSTLNTPEEFLAQLAVRFLSSRGTIFQFLPRSIFFPATPLLSDCPIVFGRESCAVANRLRYLTSASSQPHSNPLLL